MRILAIETSCDETAIAIADFAGDDTNATLHVLGNALHSQIEMHKQYGGVYPALAKRAHAENLVPCLSAALGDAGLLEEGMTAIPEGFDDILSREHELADRLRAFFGAARKPGIDVIAVTAGPGLEPALWVGINFAKALAKAWDLPIVPVDHMEGHLLAGVGREEEGAIVIKDVALPMLGLLISGGHTELDLMKAPRSYERMGATRDDAVGEAYDKVARMMDLPYPGGPEISRLAEAARERGAKTRFTLPRPMLATDDCDFSFSGLKTAILYLLKGRGPLSDEEKEELALAFEDTVAEVLWVKTARALERSGAKTLAIGGGVSANKNIKRVFTERIAEQFPGVELRIPAKELTTDNAVMIAIAGSYRAARGEYADPDAIVANGTKTLA